MTQSNTPRLTSVAEIIDRMADQPSTFDIEVFPGASITFRNEQNATALGNLFKHAAQFPASARDQRLLGTPGFEDAHTLDGPTLERCFILSELSADPTRMTPGDAVRLAVAAGPRFAALLTALSLRLGGCTLGALDIA